MNKLIIPSSPNWYETDILACAPDSTLIYGSKQDIVIIKPTSENEPDEVSIISKAHSVKIISVNINHDWGNPHKYAVTVAEDNIIKLWNIETLTRILSHNKHASLDNNSRLVGASFAGEEKIISAAENGILIVWNLLKNETYVLNSVFENKVFLTCISVCPHVSWLAAVGLKSGLVVVVDLRKNGKVLHKLRGHDKAVVSLSWCPAPVNIFPVKPNNKVVQKSDKLESDPENSGKQEKITNHVEMQVTEESKDNVEGILQTNENAVALDTPKEGMKTTQDLKITEESKDNAEGILQTNENTVALDTPKEGMKTTPDLKITEESKDNAVGILQTDDNAVPLVTPKEEMETTRDLKSNKEFTSFLKDCDILRLKVLQTSSPKNEEIIEVSDTDRRLVSMEICSSIDEFVSPVDEKQQMFLSADSGSPDAKNKPMEEPFGDVTASSEDTVFSSASSCDGLTCFRKNKALGESVCSEKDNPANMTIKCDNSTDNKIDKDEQVENWRTEQRASQDEEPRREMLLASSAREGNIYIWRAGTDGRLQTFLSLPNNKHQKKNTRQEKLWITVCWVAPTILLSSSKYAELLQWTLPKPVGSAKAFRLIHRDHWSVLFSIKAPIIYSNEYSFLQETNINVWTTGMDRMILNTDLKTQKNLRAYPALGGSINCLSGSPLDPNRLACGSGEGVINVWNLSREHKKRVEFMTFYHKISSAVTALAWHPTIEMQLAWGTSEGRVGILDTLSKAKQSKILPHYFKTEIYKMEWGPLKGDIQTLGLFAVANGKLVVFTPCSQKDPETLETPDNTFVYTFAWKSDFSILLVSSKTGSLIKYSRELKIENVYYFQHKLQSIVWHPDAASNDLKEAKYCQTFASVMKSNKLVVHDLSIEADSCENRIIAHFENKGLINSAVWSPHSEDQLVFVDDLGIAQVFDLKTKAILATYLNPCLDPLLSVYWSPTDQDYIVTGTASHKIIIWKISDCPQLAPEEISNRRNRISKAILKEFTDQLPKKKAESNIEKPEADKVPAKKTVKTILPVFYSIKEKCQADDIRRLLNWRVEDNTVKYDKSDVNSVNTNNVDVINFFGGQMQMKDIVDANVKLLRQQGKYYNANMLSMFTGDLDSAVKEAIEKKSVNPWILSVCPMVSPALWEEACDTYANQLLEDPEADPLEIMTYLLARHRVEEAVKMLMDRGLFREAFALAKCRMGGNASLVWELLDKWAKNMVMQGNFELAAQFYIALEKYENAAAVLFRRSNMELLEVAVELAELSGNIELHKAVLVRYNAFKAEAEKTKENPGSLVNSVNAEGPVPDQSESTKKGLEENNYKECKSAAYTVNTEDSVSELRENKKVVLDEKEDKKCESAAKRVNAEESVPEQCEDKNKELEGVEDNESKMKTEVAMDAPIAKYIPDSNKEIKIDT